MTMGDSLASMVILCWRMDLIVSMIQLGMTVLRMFTMYYLFGKLSLWESGK